MKISNSWILSKRGQRNNVDPSLPYAWLSEQELCRNGNIEDVATIFLTNRECPLKCLMCDLWKNTSETKSVPGIIPTQIEYGLSKLPACRHIKLYNSGSFFDTGSIPQKDYPAIADRLKSFETVLVESHPRFINDSCLQFAGLLGSERLEVAMGLETVHPDILPLLNKKMTTADFRKAAGFLAGAGIAVRAFILLRPPFMTEKEGIVWAQRSIDFAFESGVECCSIIPTRGGNGAMEVLAENGQFSKPEISSLETVLEYGIGLGSGRVFSDLWDLELFSSCTRCFLERKARLERMNLYQDIPSPVSCSCP
jgi:radical SAM enzyme (TIGR01210 family)